MAEIISTPFLWINGFGSSFLTSEWYERYLVSRIPRFSWLSRHALLTLEAQYHRKTMHYTHDKYTGRHIFIIEEAPWVSLLLRKLIKYKLDPLNKTKISNNFCWHEQSDLLGWGIISVIMLILKSPYHLWFQVVLYFLKGPKNTKGDILWHHG